MTTENHKGQVCIVTPALLCQEGYCSECCIWLERNYKANDYEFPVCPFPPDSREGKIWHLGFLQGMRAGMRVLPLLILDGENPKPELMAAVNKFLRGGH